MRLKKKSSRRRLRPTGAKHISNGYVQDNLIFYTDERKSSRGGKYMNMNNSLRGCRPYPIDKDRQNRCMSVLNDAGMTITELAGHIGVSKVYCSNVISGRELTESGETRIARFLGYQRTDLFPLRTNQQIADMRVAEQKRKQALAEKKNARMLRKTGAA